MEQKAKKTVPAWVILCVIALVAGLLLGATNMFTAQEIAAQEIAAADQARKIVLPSADAFEELPLTGDSVDYCYKGTSGGETAGHVCQVTVKGYGGEIEVTVGIDNEGTVTGISVGGANFSETAGLGAKTKDAEFMDQFAGMVPPLAVQKDGGDVDAVTGATRSSRAVTSAVNTAAEYVAALAE